MADYKTYLATSILTEDKIITYRLLSRTLKVHVNAAKEMLYDFHRSQNAKKPGTIHATYLLSGTKRSEEPVATNGGARNDGEDDYMQSSPFMGSSMPQIDHGTGASGVLSITLVKEQDLEGMKAAYDHISSIHIYSIGPHPLRDLQTLSDVCREAAVLTSTEDALGFAQTYGTILNKNVKRRPNRRPPPIAAAAPPAVKPQSAKAKAPEPAKAKPEPKATPISSTNDFFGKGKEKAKSATAAAASSSKESTPAPPALKKETSSIFKSFAKAKPKLKREDTDTSAASKAEEDSPMRDVVDDDEEETYVPPVPVLKEGDAERKSRTEREAALRKMMDDEEEEEEEVVAKTKVESEEATEESEAPVEVKEEQPVASGGRRRGRRRVMQKKRIKDEEGYMVTKEEAVWESFSEDEAPEKSKPKLQSSTSASTKAKKPVGKAAQGNIMSFFGKK